MCIVRAQKQATSVLDMCQKQSWIQLCFVAHLVLLQNVHQTSEVLIGWDAMLLELIAELLGERRRHSGHFAGRHFAAGYS